MSSLSTSVKPLVDAANAATSSGGTVTPTAVGGGTAGVVQTRGPSGAAISSLSTAGSTTATGLDATATGVGASANGDGATAYGAWARANGANTTAVGFRALASSPGATALGQNAQATSGAGVAVGQNAMASGNNAVALGANATASADRSVALGTGSVADQAGTVSVGSAGAERRITNVAPGINPTDAVNLSQLRDVSKLAYSGTAMSLAMSGAVMPTLGAGEFGVGVGIGHYKSYTAMSLRFQGMSGDGSTAFGAGLSTTGKEWGLQLGVGIKWK